ncbi:uncharacterized protein LOC116299106 [Actinia tenebrosa]|uniref:Uncharacterized protein LOC116299106 n=1 Tax=Actinia tenebrosa TaxID=6105 RepID=A0A6P8IDM6_ACTTE|nr:uncharacterized protein LOC116299106 [Actinia tenebrosa]
MDLNIFVFFGIFLYDNFSTEGKKVTPDGVVHEAFKADAFRRITTHLIETHIVNKLGSCAFRCSKHLECVSFNFGNRMNGKHGCQLLRTDKYNSGSSYVTDTDFHYFYPVNKCMGSSPCLYNGTCYPDYDNDDYNCVCTNLTTGKNCEIHKSCLSVYSLGARVSGVYLIDPDGQGSFPVYCDMTTDGGVWNVFQKRFDGSLDFYRGWQDYKNGFGDLTGEFWLGLEKIHRLVKTNSFTLRVELEDWNGSKGHAVYSSFKVAGESDSYRLDVSGFGGTAGDALLEGNALEIHTSMPFTTHDRDNDENTAGNCAVDSHGAWWYKNCYSSNLNGKYTGNAVDVQGMVWKTLTNERRGLKKVEMKIRPSDFVGSPCSSSPCKNRGTCTVTTPTTFQCTCSLGVTGSLCDIVKRDCLALYSAGYTSDGVYTIKPDSQSPFRVYCDMTSNNDGWTVIQRRTDGSTDFFLGWQDYKTGFGNPNGEYWLGNEKIHRLTSLGQNTLRVELEAWDGSKYFANYSSFLVAKESESYRLNVSGYQGTAGDSLSDGANQNVVSNGMKFSTRDMDNDLAASSCANTNVAGWWFRNCSASNLNGRYLGDNVDTKGVTWYSLSLEYRSLKKAQMKIKLVVTPCTSEPCLNGAACTVTSSSNFSCTCTPGFMGSLCDQVITPCTSMPCFNGATCVVTSPSNFSCNCKPGFTGSRCDEVVTPCTSMPCKNGATCSVTSSSTFSCNCVFGFTGSQCEKAFRDCSVFHKANPSLPNGVYTIQPGSQKSFNVSCDMTTDGGGWTVFQKRLDGSVSFERGWADYKTGFGDLNGEFWLGNDYLHRLTKSTFLTLRIRVYDWAGNMVHAEYSVVTVGNENSKYLLTLKGLYKGDDGNAMSAHNNALFSTSDSDNDDSAGNCATEHKGGFWYKSCIENGASPNGAYLGNVVNQQGVVWKSWKNTFENMKTIQMMLRTPNYDGAIKDKNGKACFIPYNFKGVDYYACTNEGSFWGTPWCSYQYDYIDNSLHWGYCN